jgi:sugar-specific transcriptional regulator TrmB
LIELPLASRATSRDGESADSARSSARLLQGLAVFGISAREGRLYLALAVGGPMSAHDATAAAGLQRATAYRILLRLLHRGLVLSDGNWPQRFYALPLGAVYGRMQSFFSDEEELRHRMASCYGTLAGELSAQAAARTVEIVSSRGSGSSRILQEIAHARRQIDVMIRPRSAASGFRNEVARTLAGAIAHGVKVRLLTDVPPADRQFLERLYRDFDSANHFLEVRHYSPLAGHFYVLDSRTALRFSVLGGFSRAPDVGIVCADPTYVRIQAARFEALWVEAVPALVAARSTRASGWLNPRKSVKP